MKFDPHLPMKTQSLLRLLCALFSCALPVTLQAKEKNPGHSGSIQFSCATWDTLPNQELFYQHGGEYLPIELSVGQRSKAYPLKGVEALELFIRKATVAGAAESNAAVEYERVGTAPLLPDAKRMLFLIDAKKDAKKDAKSLPLRVLGIDDSLEIFPAGSYRFFNQTPGLLRIDFGGATHDFPPGELKIVTPVLPEAGGFLPVVIKNEQGLSLLENRFLAQRTGRELVIISPPAEGRTGIAIQSLSEIIPVSPPNVKKPTSRK
jgi:hypothetical protein